MKRSLFFSVLSLFIALPLVAAEPPRPPIVNDTALKIELLVTTPDVEACTTVCGAPDGSFYVGNDPRDGRLSTSQPVNTIVRFSSMGIDRKRTVFADKIYSPAGSAWHDGYLYVLHDPLLTRFKDTDGDGIADVREDLVTNLGIPPNEGLNDHVVSGFTLGMDGFWYISVGDRGIFEAKSVKDGSTITMQGGGIARCRTDGTQLEVFSTGTRNHLQVNLDAEDNAFTRDNTDDGNGWWTRLTHHIEGGYYGYPYDYRKAPNYGVTQPSQQTLDAIKQHGGNDQWKMTNDQASAADASRSLVTGHWSFLPAMADFGGGSPTGGLCYLSDGLPEQYRGRHFFSEWGKAGVFVTEVARDGATFRLVSDTKLIEPEKGGDFRPMQLSVAADGSLLIADWGYGGWKSPRVAGAIWRLSWPEAKPAPRLKDESKATVEELLAALGHPDRDQRLRAQWSIIRRSLPDGDAPLFSALEKTVSEASAPAIQRAHALWTMRAFLSARPPSFNLDSSITGSTGDAALAALLSNEPVLQRQAMQAFPHDVVSPLMHNSKRLTFKGALLKTDVVDERIPASKPSWLYPADAESRRMLVTSIGNACRFSAPLNLMPALIAALDDDDAWVRASARIALRQALTESHDVEVTDAVTKACKSNVDRVSEGAFAVLAQEHIEASVAGLVSILADKKVVKSKRARAIAALGRIAYQPKPYDGHWWGTQPVKNPAPLNSVPWEGTPAALGALTVALADADAGVRLAAAKAFALFLLSPADPAGASASGSAPAGTILVPAAPGGEKIPPAAPAIPTANTKIVTSNAKIATPNAKIVTGNAKIAAGSPKIPAPGDKKETAKGEKAKEEAAIAGDHRALSTTALAMLRARLTAETEPAVRRQLIEALGVQKDPQAMAVFRQIALDERADAEFRETAIGAVVNIGGDGAKKVIAQLADAKLSPAATRTVIKAAGELKVLEAAPALIAHLKDENTGNREFSAKSLQQLGPKSNQAAVAVGLTTKTPRHEEDAKESPFVSSSLRGSHPASAALIDALADKDGKVQAAAIEALGSYRERAALPALIALAEKKRAMKETIGALANMPDESAIPVLVETLREKNTGVRRSAIKALKTMREKAWPQVEALLASGRVPEELVPEIRNAFESGAIVKWKMVGVFENVWEAVHPPEKDFLAEAGKVALSHAIASGQGLELNTPWLLAQKYHNAEGKDAGWIDVTADATEGRVDLGQVFKTSAMVCAYAFTEIDAPEAAEAKLFTSVDDEIAVWLNGQQIQNLSGSHGYEPDKYETHLQLKAGKNALFVKIGNKAGSWVFHARIPGFENGKFIKSKEPMPDEKQRLFALATKPNGTYANPGNAKNGEKLFFDPAAGMGAICATCHAVKGKGGQIGPDLGTVAANYKRPDLIVSLHEPSKTIALGFEQVMVETKGGEVFAGALRQETAEALTVVGADGQPHAVKKADVKTQTHVPVSLMPAGLTLGLKPQEFADLLAYLETLTGK